MVRIAIAVDGRKEKRVKSVKERCNKSRSFVKKVCGGPKCQPRCHDETDCGWQSERERVNAENQVRDPDCPHGDRWFMQPDVVLAPPFVVIREPGLIVEREFERMFRQIPCHDGVEPFIPIGDPAMSDMPQHQSTGGYQDAK